MLVEICYNDKGICIVDTRASLPENLKSNTLGVKEFLSTKTQGHSDPVEDTEAFFTEGLWCHLYSYVFEGVSDGPLRHQHIGAIPILSGQDLEKEVFSVAMWTSARRIELFQRDPDLGLINTCKLDLCSSYYLKSSAMKDGIGFRLYGLYCYFMADMGLLVEDEISVDVLDESCIKRVASETGLEKDYIKKAIITTAIIIANKKDAKKLDGNDRQQKGLPQTTDDSTKTSFVLEDEEHPDMQSNYSGEGFI